jgi:hypothetical protein
MSWGDVLGGVLITVVLLYLPGSIVLRSGGFRWLTAAFLAPGISIALILVAGILAGLLHVPFAWFAGSVLLAGTTTIAAMCATRLCRRSPAPFEILGLNKVLVTSGIAAVLAAMAITSGIGSPSDVSLLPDNAYHLGTVEWLRRHQSVSLLDTAQYSRLDTPISYPGVFHVLAALVAQWSGMATAPAVHALLLVLCAVVWPMGMGILGKVTFPRGGETAAIISVLISDVPYQLLSWGSVWPYLSSVALLPAALALMGALRASRSSVGFLGRWEWRGIAVLTALLLSILATHPSSLVAAAFIGVFMMTQIPLDRTSPSGARPWARTRRLVLTVFVTSVLALLLALVAPSSMRTWVNTEKVMTLAEAIARVLTPSSGSGNSSVVWILLTMAGLIVCLRTRVVWLVVAWIFFATASGLVLRGFDPVRLVTWPWWSDSPRIEAVVGLLSILSVTAVVDVVVSDLSRLLEPRRGWRSVWLPYAPLAILMVALGGSVATNARVIAPGYGDDVRLMPVAKREALARIASVVPPGALVATNPRRGGTVLYVVGGPALLYPTWLTPQTPDTLLVAGGLDVLQTRPDVCDAVHRLGVTHVMVGGPMDPWTLPWDTVEYAGVDRVSPAFPLLVEEPPYSVFQVPDCLGSSPGHSNRP